MATTRPQTMAKRARELATRERRERKQAKKRDRMETKRAEAAAEQAATQGDVGSAKVDGRGDEAHL
jgi:hypothetical protein